jgi:uncharacterized protein YdeI (YjbR/CyaY-like superfamily)
MGGGRNIMGEDFSKLKRPKQAMPGFVKQALKKRELLEAYKKRPAYQQNDYLSWISDGKLQDIKLERLEQMLNELDKGGIYMNMEYIESEKKNK